MKPVTEQRRQELIADCEKEIVHAKKILSSASLAPGWRKIHEKNLWKNEIALASLTAVPIGFTFTDTDEDSGGNLYESRDFSQFKDGEDYEPVYTAPPVPVIPDGYVLVPKEPTEEMIIYGFESWPAKGFSSEEELSAYEAMSGCEQAAHKAKLCWHAMIDAATSK